jgi:hypothetical protein
MITTTATLSLTDNRIDGIVARQRSSRTRDLVFAALLAIGLGLSLGALRHAAAQAETPVACTVAPVTAG